MISNLWKWAHLERSVFHVIKLSAFSWPIRDLWCQMLVKVIQHFNKIPSFSPHTSSLSDADLNTEGATPLVPSYLVYSKSNKDINPTFLWYFIFIA